MRFHNNIYCKSQVEPDHCCTDLLRYIFITELLMIVPIIIVIATDAHLLDFPCSVATKQSQS